jgi:membrane protein YdbS with pleckstrin-like domain
MPDESAMPDESPMPDGSMSLDTTGVAPAQQPGWQLLPPRARRLFMLTDAFVLAVIAAFASWIFSEAIDLASPWRFAMLGLVLGALIGAVTGTRRQRRTQWLLDADGFALARGHWWRRETRVPASRVQHLDLKHGPLERRWRLATLVIHTAGSKMSAVSVSGLDAADAERLRDRLARQLDDDDDAL